MTKELLKEFEALIIAKQEAAKQTCREIKESLAELERSGCADESDMSSAITERDVLLVQLTRQETFLVDLGLAMRRIRAGTYGICQATNKNIPLERLRAHPTASMALSEKEAAKKMEGLPKNKGERPNYLQDQ